MTAKTKDIIEILVFVLTYGIIGYFQATRYDAAPLDAFLNGALIYGGTAIAIGGLWMLYKVSNK